MWLYNQLPQAKWWQLTKTSASREGAIVGAVTVKGMRFVIFFGSDAMNKGMGKYDNFVKILKVLAEPPMSRKIWIWYEFEIIKLFLPNFYVEL